MCTYVHVYLRAHIASTHMNYMMLHTHSKEKVELERHRRSSAKVLNEKSSLQTSLVCESRYSFIFS